MKEPGIEKKVNGDAVYYLLRWSHLRKADRHEISGGVPSMAGVYEIYYRDERKVLRMLTFARAWYGGLRNSIREATDPELVRDPRRRDILSRYDAYYRYAPVASHGDMTDLLFFFAQTYVPEDSRHPSSGRYEDVFVEEVAPDRIVDLD